MAQSDDIATLAEVLVRMHQRGGQAASIRQQRGLNASAVGKACGVTASQIVTWESGTAQPTTAQALQWLRTLHQLAPDFSVAQARSMAAEREAAETRQVPAETPVEW